MIILLLSLLWIRNALGNVFDLAVYGHLPRKARFHVHPLRAVATGISHNTSYSDLTPRFDPLSASPWNNCLNCDSFDSLIALPYFLRCGSTKQELKGAALNTFLLRKQGRHWDGVRVPRIAVKDLKKETLRYFRKEAQKSNRLSKDIIEKRSSPS
jgi:hypothetical protein